MAAPVPSEFMRTRFGVLSGSDTVLAALRAMDRWPGDYERAIIECQEGSNFYYCLFAMDLLFAFFQKDQGRTGWESVTVGDALRLRESDSHPTVAAHEPLPPKVRGAIVIDDGRPVGYFTEADIPIVSQGASPSESESIDLPLSGTLRGGDLDFGGPSSLEGGATTVPRDSDLGLGGLSSFEMSISGDLESPPRKSGNKKRAKPPSRSSGGAAASMTYVPPAARREEAANTKDFTAYPRLDLLKDRKQPKTVAPGDELIIIAGFRVDLDVEVAETGAIGVKDVQPGETCLLHFFLKGLEITDSKQFADARQPHWDLALEPTATVPEFGVRVIPDATEVECKVEYYIRGVMAGIARRKLPLVGSGEKVAKINPCRFNPEDAEPVDLTISITHGADGHIEFVFSGAAVGADPIRCPGKSDLPDSLQLARDLYDSLKQLDFRSTDARDVLDNTGQLIQRLLPNEFFECVRKAQTRSAIDQRQLPTILLITDEAYIPWELTLFDDPNALFDPAAPPYLGAQTIMGRWIPRDYIRMPPAAVCDVRKFQVFASSYTESSTRQRELLAAVKEQERLVAEFPDWNPEPYQARIADLTKVKADATQGKVVHFAIHGLSDPKENKQVLILTDKRVPSNSLVGAYRCGQPPRFSFVFMNACQLGIPGQSLGEVGGIPGVLVGGGAYGVIAPLWDVHDDVAQECALAFYKAVFTEGKSVAEALRERRATYGSDSTTPVAYVYYGHPGLKLRKAKVDG